jgi:uncharacterized protein (TIGR02147 family)
VIRLGMQTLDEVNNYRVQLKSELSRRKMHNHQYSLRTFAKTIGVSVAFLSKILKGEKDLSIQTAVRVAEKLGYNAVETAQFCQAVQLSKTDDPKLKSALMNRFGAAVDQDADYHLIDLSGFQIISDWHHLAILELSSCRMSRKAGPFNATYVASRLGISKDDAASALQRLVRAGLLEKNLGQWVKTKKLLSASSELPSRAIRNFHLQMIEKAKNSIDGQPISLRDISAITVPISLDKLDLARREIKNFRRRMMKVLESSKATEVYQLNVQLFSLTEPSGPVHMKSMEQKI